MSTLWHHLQRLPHRDLRAMATRLSLRRSNMNQKEAWTQAIHAFLLSPQAPLRLFSLLSMSAQSALRRLLAVEALPTALFLAEYGPIRRPTPQLPARAKPVTGPTCGPPNDEPTPPGHPDPRHPGAAGRGRICPS
ncbi:MAG: hypothetical protein KatS3mg050_1264 [Litorilinea sp.]|nr:MAG: hypothetical protein KatS3mg050_1264 [Litorilinea sp.]